MGKIVTVYLSDEEVKDLKTFCDDNRCTQYSALKTAVKELISKPVKQVNDKQFIRIVESSSEKDLIKEESPREKKETNEADASSLNELLKQLMAKPAQELS